MAHCRSDRHKDIQLAGHDVGREDPVQDADVVLHRVSVPVSDRRPHRPSCWERHLSTGSLADRYFVIAHFHYVIVGAILFVFLAPIYYWYPKITGRMLNEGLGKRISGCS